MISKYGNSAVVQITTVFEPVYLDIYLTTFSGVRNFGKKSAMRVIVFPETF